VGQKVVRTVKLKLSWPREEAGRFVSLYTDLCNFASRVAFSLTRRAYEELNRLCYYEARARFGLSAQLIHLAGVLALRLHRREEPPGHPLRVPSLSTAPPRRLERRA
jgi:hypothetical protein